MTDEEGPYSVGFAMLRDHTEKCDHGFYLSHYWNSYVGECPGGREVPIDDLLEETWQAGQASWPIEDARLHPDQFPQLAAIEEDHGGTRQ